MHRLGERLPPAGGARHRNALQLGPASRVASIDKLSLAFTVLLAVPVLGEPLTWRLALGVGLMIAGALVTVR